MSEEQIIVQLNPDVPPTGSDLGIVNAARKSFGRRSEWDYKTVMGEDENGRYEDTQKVLKDKDKRLLEFLARGMTANDFESFVYGVSHKGCRNVEMGFHPRDIQDLTEKLWEWRNTPTHDTPFNHGFFSFEVKAPVFVRAQLVKHEYLIMSEYSRRYITDDVEFYEPDVWRGAAENKKQGSLGEANAGDVPLYVSEESEEVSLRLYKTLLDVGVAPEQARMVLPQSLMTAWTWSGTLGAFAKMCQLRCHPEAQYESRLVANKVYEELKKQFPVAAPLLVEGVY